MKKRTTRIFAVTASAVLIVLLGLVYYFRFTMRGQYHFYDLFGGNDLHLVSRNRELYWFDVMHTNDPNARIFPRIEESMTSFAPDLVLVEGGFDTFEGDRAGAIAEGEIAFAAYIAKQGGIPVADIEPPFDKQVDFLLSKYQAEDIYAMHLIRQITSYTSRPGDTQIELREILETQTEFLRGHGLAIDADDIEQMLEIINRYLPEALNEVNWRELDSRELDYVFTREDGALYPVYRDVYNYRNIYVVQLIEEKQTDYDRIYIAMGGQHLRDTEDELLMLYAS